MKNVKCSDSPESVKAKRDFVAKQTKEAASMGHVTLRNCGEIRTGTIPVWMAFRCLYCGEYFNQTMAEEHFGMTQKQLFDQALKPDKESNQKRKIPSRLPCRGKQCQECPQTDCLSRIK
jgi:hypothetical protein